MGAPGTATPEDVADTRRRCLVFGAISMGLAVSISGFLAFVPGQLARGFHISPNVAGLLLLLSLLLVSAVASRWA